MTHSSLKVGIVTVSDRASRGEYEDRGGPAIRDWLDRAITSDWNAEVRLVPDELPTLAQTLRELVDEAGCQLVLTTGGTGPAARDITPEATLEVADKVLDGFGEKMRAISLQYVPTAILSRQVGVIRKQALIVNLPGNPKAVAEILDELFEVIPYTIELLEGPRIQCDPEVVVPFRPKHAK
ncbi:molybdopterin adenylyltransferase [Bradymonas sediminis]|uniref:Molybdopterin adenylyltransferase n=1 Tax=Bradymonas sediminis TaxID=1548548 RepID=A0A2Z4FQ45_9DELT|nr:molybdopterin adenylyltransferase [Bradymonas sediminis]AWV90895.1 molybdopterin adenylyltransferase [Bradymonas sediminis]TDP75369.1 molybdopterin adenylyltransferase [Bradymonas sediminis]